MQTILCPVSLLTIGTNAFNGCSSFTTITLYSNIVNIGNTIFNNCPKLTLMNLNLPNPSSKETNTPIYLYTVTNYPAIYINVKYISNTNTSNSSTITYITPTTTTTSEDINTINCNVLAQVRRSRISNGPPIRYELNSPYPAYTKEQLDMRRKVEILQYNANKQNTKQNGTTKKSAFSHLVNNSTIGTTNNSIITRKVCENNTIPVPTSSSDIPGPVQYLYLDPSVPLYNYIPKRTFNLFIEVNTEQWNIVTYKDVEMSDTDDKTILSIYIRLGILNTYTTYSFIAPVSILINGVNNTNTEYDLDFTRNIVTITVTKLIFQIHYNQTPVQTITINNPTNSDNITKITDLYLDTRSSGGLPFSASIYIGNLEVNNVYLYTPPNFIYDINVLATVILNTGSSDYNETAYFNDISYTAVYNPENTENSTSNCIAYSNTTNTPQTYVNGF
jgi:hypothetical protein